MSVDAGLVASRFFHYLGVQWLFGVALFPLYTGASSVERRLRSALLAASMLALVSGIAWAVFTVAGMAGGFAALTAGATWRAVFQATAFGPLWSARLALTLLLAVLVLWPHPSLRWPVAMLAGVVVASLAGTGHAQSDEGWAGALHVGADALHLLAAGAWLGGLVALAIAARRGSHEEAASAFARFSGIGYAAVATLLLSGIVSGWFLVGSLDNLLTTPYGRLLMSKVVLFGFMVALAGFNRFNHVPALTGHGHEAGVKKAFAGLRRNVLREQLLGVTVIAIVSVLGTMATPAGQ